MRRRDFAKVIAAGAATVVMPGSVSASSEAMRTATQPKSKKVLMHVGTQRGTQTDEYLQFLARHGVYHVFSRGT